MKTPTKPVKVKMIVEEGGDDALHGWVYVGEDLVVADGGNLGNLKINMHKILQDLHNFGGEEIVWEIVWLEPAEPDEIEYTDVDDDGPQDLFDEQDDGCGYGEIDMR